MVLLTSGSYIKLHAVFQLVLAAYLTKSREVITDDEFVHGTDNGRLCIVCGLKFHFFEALLTHSLLGARTVTVTDCGNTTDIYFSNNKTA